MLSITIGGHQRRSTVIYWQYLTFDIDASYSVIGKKYVRLKILIPILQYWHYSSFRYPILNIFLIVLHKIRIYIHLSTIHMKQTLDPMFPGEPFSTELWELSTDKIWYRILDIRKNLILISDIMSDSSFYSPI